LSVLVDEWTIRSAVFDGAASWVANQALLTFEDAIVRRRRLPPVRFVAEDEYVRLVEHLYAGRSPRTKQNLLRLLPQFVRRYPATQTAAELRRAPRDLSTAWLQALSSSIATAPAEWRAPQIVFPAARRAEWPDATEIAGTYDGGAFRRVLVELERYDDHSFACADWDPWDQRHLHRPTPGRDDEKPRCLPKPPELRDVLLHDLPGALDVVRRLPSERFEGYRFYVPASGWEPASLPCDRWREGAFPLGKLNGRRGPLDAHGHVWDWDPRERHWDVQLDDDGRYCRVSHDGSLL
jgi:hypothetical protein